MTGVKFDPSNFKALTLGNIFQMELHRFTADIDDIVNESVQELKIENEIRKVEATWRKTDLVLAKYQKNGVDRSFVLKASDEIKTELEDNLLNLQTMSSSRFVGSFADQVQYTQVYYSDQGYGILEVYFLQNFALLSILEVVLTRVLWMPCERE